MDNFAYIKVENATFADGFNYGLYKAGTQVTVTANEGYELCSPCPEYVTVDENGEILLTVPEEKTVFEEVIVEDAIAEEVVAEDVDFEEAEVEVEVVDAVDAE